MLETKTDSIILNNNATLLQSLQDRRVFEQFMHKPNHVTCDAPKGRLVKETPLEQFTSSFKDTYQDAKNLGNALKTGKSNDHSLGRMNDLGMKVGGGLIAAALMGTKATNNKKLMELLGFGTFFSVMSLWPKVAIDLPTKLRYGFNPHQKYIDSQGRKKQFFLDNQYLPWDVWSKEEINKVADKMKVPHDLQDREEFTKEKMRTIALQDNTLWMLTAGFATPLLTSLACNRIEEGMRGPVNKFNLFMLGKNIEKTDKTAAKLVADTKIFGAQDAEFGELMTELRSGRVPENFVSKLDNIFDLTNVADDAIRATMSKENKGTADLVAKLFQKTDIAFEESDFLKHLTEGQSKTEASKVLKELNSAKKELSKNGSIPTLAEVIEAVKEKRGACFSLDGQPEWVRRMAGLSQDEIAQYAKGTAAYDKEALSAGANALETIYTHKIKPAQAQMKIFGKNIKALNNISGEKYNRSARAIIKAFKFTDKEITTLRNSNESFGDVLQDMISKKLAELAKPGNEAKLQKTLRRLDKELEAVDKGSTERHAAGKIQSLFDEAIKKLRKALGATPEKLDEKEVSHLGKLEGTKLGKLLSATGVTDNEAQIAKGSMTSVNSTVTAFKNAIELERKIANGTFYDEWKEAAKACSFRGEIPGGKEGLYKLARKFAWQSSYGDLMNKGHMEGNGTFFESVVRAVFSGASENADVAEWQKATRKVLLETQYIPNPSLERGAAGAAKAHSIQFAEFGESLLSAGKKQIDQMYNDRKWMKTFGGITAALVGITLISQLFFGKVKDQDLYKTKQQDTFESGK